MFLSLLIEIQGDQKCIHVAHWPTFERLNKRMRDIPQECHPELFLKANKRMSHFSKIKSVLLEYDLQERARPKTRNDSTCSEVKIKLKIMKQHCLCEFLKWCGQDDTLLNVQYLRSSWQTILDLEPGEWPGHTHIKFSNHYHSLIIAYRAKYSLLIFFPKTRF